MKTQLTHKNVQTNPEKSQKNHTTLLLFYVDTRIFFKAIRGNGYRFVHKGGTFTTENHHSCCERLRFVRSIYPNLPQMGQKIYHSMLMPLHDSMPSFMNFRRALDLLEFKNQVSQCLQPTDGGRVLDMHSHFSVGLKHAPKDKYLIFQPIYMHWSMCM